MSDATRMPKKMSATSLNAPDADPARDGGPREAAHYIKGVIAELALLARTHRLDMLGYLLDMAHLEAEDAVRRNVRDPG